MAAYVVFEVEIRDADRWHDFSRQLKPVLEAAGGKYILAYSIDDVAHALDK